MPSKESLERSWKFNGHHTGCACSDCWALADLLDEAIREARLATIQDAIQIATGYANVITSPFCREQVAIADCMIGAAKEIERALLVRLAQLREGKT